MFRFGNDTKGSVPFVSLIGEAAAVPFQRLLGLLAVFMPSGDDDVLACTWQGIGFVEVFHVETWRVTSGHPLCGIVVAVETQPVVLSEDGLPVLETPSVIGKELVLAV